MVAKTSNDKGKKSPSLASLANQKSPSLAEGDLGGGSNGQQGAEYGKQTVIENPLSIIRVLLTTPLPHPHSRGL